MKHELTQEEILVEIKAGADADFPYPGYKIHLLNHKKSFPRDLEPLRPGKYIF